MQPEITSWQRAAVCSQEDLLLSSLSGPSVERSALISSRVTLHGLLRCRLDYYVSQSEPGLDLWRWDDGEKTTCPSALAGLWFRLCSRDWNFCICVHTHLHECMHLLEKFFFVFEWPAVKGVRLSCPPPPLLLLGRCEEAGGGAASRSPSNVQSLGLLGVNSAPGSQWPVRWTSVPWSP